MQKRERAHSCAKAILCAFASLLAFSASSARAVENNAVITPFGVTDFGAGLTAPASPYGFFGVRPAYYSANVLRDGAGNRVNNNFKITVESLALAYFYKTDIDLLGGKVVLGGVVPLLSMHGNFDVQTPVGGLNFNNSDTAVGDIQLIPLMLQWDMPPHTFINAGLSVQAPTGDYDVRRAFNVGVNHWTISPFVGATYISEGGFEISTQAQLNFNTENPDTHYTSGIEYKQEFAVGQHFGPWTLGMGGYAYQQISDDSGAGVINGNRSRVFGLGPAISFVKPGLPVVSLHGYREFMAENHSEGYNIALRVGMSF